MQKLNLKKEDSLKVKDLIKKKYNGIKRKNAHGNHLWLAYLILTEKTRSKKRWGLGNMLRWYDSALRELAREKYPLSGHGRRRWPSKKRLMVMRQEELKIAESIKQILNDYEW